MHRRVALHPNVGRARSLSLRRKPNMQLYKFDALVASRGVPTRSELLAQDVNEVQVDDVLCVVRLRTPYRWRRGNCIGPQSPRSVALLRSPLPACSCMREEELLRELDEVVLPEGLRSATLQDTSVAEVLAIGVPTPCSLEIPISRQRTSSRRSCGARGGGAVDSSPGASRRRRAPAAAAAATWRRDPAPPGTLEREEKGERRREAGTKGEE